jgi:exopolysaccharide biosynthesis operon protein EpsL
VRQHSSRAASPLTGALGACPGARGVKKSEDILKKHPIRPLLPIAVLIMAPAVMAQPQAPESTDAFQFRAGLGVEHDSNVLRQPNAVSDTAVTAAVGLKFDRRYSLQRFRADVEAATYRYQDHTDLSYSTLNYNAAWDWSFTPRVHGTVSADRKQYRDTTSNTLTGVNVVGRRTERTELAEGVYELGAAWRALAGVSHTSAKSTQPNSYDASPTVRSAYLGAGYELASGASITGRFRHGNGEYTDPTAGPATGFRENEADVLFKWPVTAKTSLEGRIGHLDRKHSGAPQRDFSGVVGDATVNWEITGKTRLMAQVAHDLTATGLPTGGHVEANRFWVQPTWKPTVQTAVNLRYEYIRRTWQSIPLGSPDIGRNERIQNAMIGFDWQPRPKIAVSASIRNERLRSNLVFSGYRATIYGIAGKLYF